MQEQCPGVESLVFMATPNISARSPVHLEGRGRWGYREVAECPWALLTDSRRLPERCRSLSQAPRTHCREET